MRTYIKISALLMLALSFIACKKILEPENDNHNTFQRALNDPYFAEGLLIRAYTFIPTNGFTYVDVATDDAVSNNKNFNYTRMATGEWSAIYNPEDLYPECNQAIMYINQFLEVVEKVNWFKTDNTINLLYQRRLKGESLALRGLFKYYLARNHGGVGSTGELLGLPVYNEFVSDVNTFSNSPRIPFTAFATSAYADLDEAISLLPMDYGNLSDISQVPSGITGLKNIDQYNDVFGDYSQQRVSGRIAKALKAKLALLEASPAFNLDNNAALWQKAATITSELLRDKNGIAGIDPTGHLYYLKTQVDAADLTSGDKLDIGEMLWRRPFNSSSSYREVANFPPSLYGSGDVNPTQNLVESFPMKNGYPITHPSSAYNAAQPYNNRDPRLAAYIVYNGSRLQNKVITTAAGGGQDAVDSVETSTRTGYYLKKLLREDVNTTPGKIAGQKQYEVHIRYTELYLNYAEAANEAWGPNGGPYPAIEVIRAIRKRAGITQPDNYLATISTKEELRQLIKNERRLELCFEGHRFWDLRRWKDDLTVPAYGVKIAGGVYTRVKVEDRVYDNSFMIYGPLPAAEVTKFKLIQNKGW